MRSGVTAAFLLSLVVAFAAGEPADDVAILARAPHPREGIPWLGPNTLPSLTATYRYAGFSVEVVYTAAAIPLRRSWARGACPGTLEVTSSTTADRLQSSSLVLIHPDRGGWSLFFAFPRELEPDRRCSFVARFVPSFLSFLSATREEASSSFPAVLQ